MSRECVLNVHCSTLRNKVPTTYLNFPVLNIYSYQFYAQYVIYYLYNSVVKLQKEMCCLMSCSLAENQFSKVFTWDMKFTKYRRNGKKNKFWVEVDSLCTRCAIIIYAKYLLHFIGSLNIKLIYYMFSLISNKSSYIQITIK